jgi:hypothetical protein
MLHGEFHGVVDFLQNLNASFHGQTLLEFDKKNVGAFLARPSIVKLDFDS